MLTDERNVPLTGITAVFITDIYDQSGGGFFNFLTLTHMIPEHLILVNYSVETVPYVSPSKRFKLSRLTERAYQLTLCYGFMDTVSIPQALYVINDRGLLPFQVDVEHVVYFLEMPYILPSSSNTKVLPIWGQEWLFALLVRNYSTHLGVAFYQLPNDRTIAMGSYYVV
jgi:KUP system potassium uptake protein